MQYPSQTPLGDQPGGRVDMPGVPITTDTVQGAAQWLRQTGLEDDNFDDRQWWEESDEESEEERNHDFGCSPSRVPRVDVPGQSEPTSSVQTTHNKVSRRKPVPAAPDSHGQKGVVNIWQKHQSKWAYIEDIEDPSLMPAPLKIQKRQEAPKTPSPIVWKPQVDIKKPLPALPDMRITGEMANGVKILSLSEAQARLKAKGYEVSVNETPNVKDSVEVVVTPQAPARRGTTRRLLGSFGKFKASTASSSTTSKTDASADLRPASLQTTSTQPKAPSPTRVGGPRRDTLWTDFMNLPEYNAPPSRPPPPPPTSEDSKCNCPEHRLERGATHTIPRKPVPAEHERNEAELMHSPSVQNEITRLEDRMQLSFDPDDDYDREPVVDTFVRAGHTSIHITERVGQNTIASHYGREERLDGDENVEKAKAKWAAYHEAKKVGLQVKTPSPTTTTFRQRL